MSEYNPYTGKKRGRGRPKKVRDPHCLPVECCANCSREVCTSNLSKVLRETVTDTCCCDYLPPANYGQLAK